MKFLVLLLFCAGIVGCSPDSDKTMVLNYDDFGPQVSAYETIGMNWWQWQDQGNPDPAYQYDIKVVVYRDISLQHVMEMHPVVKDKNLDYRYLPYTKALLYLNKEIESDVLAALTEKLGETKDKITTKMGK